MSKLNEGADQFANAMVMDRDNEHPESTVVRPKSSGEFFETLYELWEKTPREGDVDPVKSFVAFCQKFFMSAENRVRGYNMVTGGVAVSFIDGRQMTIRYADQAPTTSTPFRVATVPLPPDKRDAPTDGSIPLRPVPKDGRKPT